MDRVTQLTRARRGSGQQDLPVAVVRRREIVPPVRSIAAARADLSEQPALPAASRLEAGLQSHLALAQQILDEIPFGLLVLSLKGQVIWHNREAALVCQVWNDGPLQRDALPLQRSPFVVPPALWQECQSLGTAYRDNLPVEPRVVCDPLRGLHARIQLRSRKNRQEPPAFLLNLDYRRPRGDRDHPLSPSVMSLLNRLTSRQREVALRLREGLTTIEIARELHRSPLTIKTQLSGIFHQLQVSNRARVIALLNR